jgi:glycosyltransferase involved in cell wall biosynthesis
MRIIAFVNNNSGPSYHRLIMPLMLMKNADVFITNNLLEEHFEKGCDIFMYNRILPDHALPGIEKLKKKYGFKTCVDIDDFWELDEHHVLFQLYKDEDFAHQQIEQITSADIITTTHSRLAEEITPFNPNVHVLPNAIPKQGQFDIEREPHYLTRLFWQGSVTHRQDIEILSAPIESIRNIAGKVKMVMAGYTTDEPEWHQMALTYTAGLKHQYRLIPGVHVNEYYSNYVHADICLIPLVNSKFNRMKSNLKVLEAANLSLPVIASNVNPYLDMPVLYCKHSGDVD